MSTSGFLPSSLAGGFWSFIGYPKSVYSAVEEHATLPAPGASQPLLRLDPASSRYPTVTLFIEEEPETPVSVDWEPLKTPAPADDTNDYSIYVLVDDGVLRTDSRVANLEEASFSPTHEEASFSSAQVKILRAVLHRGGDTSREVVLKEFRKIQANSSLPRREAQIMSATSDKDGHPNVIEYFGTAFFRWATDLEKKTWMVMEYVDYGTLELLIHSAGQPDATEDILPKALCNSLTKDILDGLAFLHQKHIVHGDLKVDNVLLKTSSEKRFHAVIADFGLSRYCSAAVPSGIATTEGERSEGHASYMSAETHRWKIALPDMRLIPKVVSPNLNPPASVPTRFSQRSFAEQAPRNLSKEKTGDVWAFGIIALHIYSYVLPWEHVDERDIRALLGAGLRPDFPGADTHRRGLDWVMWRLLRDCWEQLPRHRVTIDTLQSLWQSEDLRTLTFSSAPNLLGKAGGWEDLTQEITIPAAALTVPRRRGDYNIIIGAKWQPAEIGQNYVQVHLVQRRDVVNDIETNTEFAAELVRWRRIRHERFEPLLGVCKIASSWYAVTPVRESYKSWSQDLDRESETHSMWYNPTSRVRMLADVSRAIEFLHMQTPPIVHGAICLDNILFPFAKSIVWQDKREDRSHAYITGYFAMRYGISDNGNVDEIVIAIDVSAFVQMVHEVLGESIEETIGDTTFEDAVIIRSLFSEITSVVERAGAVTTHMSQIRKTLEKLLSIIDKL
ncbi:kinase-like domain-containing protein [Auriculariales sp. MPI-PUGE-AT-0066]|nr:kinase-like domain-containing protein [Auriculariales sp. MPI-PUGE-AT-0066]